MNMSYTLPYVLKDYSVDDALREDAYEQATAQQRACLKNAIAFHCLTEEGAEYEAQRRTHGAKGYWHKIWHKAVPWVIAFCDAQYNSPARLVAAMMPALMAHVGCVAIMGVGGLMPSVLLAAELMGVEDVYAVPQDVVCVEFMDAIINAYAIHEGERKMGRGLFLGSRGDNTGEHLSHAACWMLQWQTEWKQKLGIPSWCEAAPPSIYVHESLGLLHKELLLWAQPDASFVAMHEARVVYGWDDTADGVLSPTTVQAWGSGMEGCFVHDDLDRRFFQNSGMIAGIL